MSRSRPHPRAYKVEFISVQKGSPHDNLTRVAIVYSKEGRVPRVDGTKFDLIVGVLFLSKVILLNGTHTEYKMIFMEKKCTSALSNSSRPAALYL